MTVKEIAEQAGVSIGTVDRVLHNRGRVSPDTKAKIDAIVQQSGFSPNPIARHLKLNKKYRFVALIPRKTEDSAYWSCAANGVEEAALEIREFGVHVDIQEFDRYEPESFTIAAHKTLAGKADGILLAPVMPEEAVKFVSRIDVPYAYFDAALPGTDPLVSIGQDALRGGNLAARLVSLFSDDDGPWAVVVVHGKDLHISRRRDSFLSRAAVLDRRVTVVEDDTLESDERAREILELILSREPETSGIFVTNASSHRFAAAAVEHRKKRRFAVVGYDLVPENEKRLRSGDIDAIISQSPEIQARKGINALYRAIVLGQQVESIIDMPLDLYIKENLPLR